MLVSISGYVLFVSIPNSSSNNAYIFSESAEVIKTCNKAIEIKPQYSEIWNNNGVALDNLGKYDEAMGAHNKATEINPQLTNLAQ